MFKNHRYEQAHKTVVKKSYKKISKRHDTFLTDMTKKARLGMVLRLVERTVFSSSVDQIDHTTWTQEAEGTLLFQKTFHWLQK